MNHESHSIVQWDNDLLVAANNIQHPGLSQIGPRMDEPWTSSLLVIAIYNMEFHSYHIQSKSIVVTFKNLNDTLHTQSTNVNHLQCHIMVPPSFNQQDKIGTLQHFFLTISRNSSSTLLFLRNICCEVILSYRFVYSFKLLYLKLHYQIHLNSINLNYLLCQISI